MVFADDGNLEFFARAKVGKHARLAHAGDFGQSTNRQAFQANLRGQAQRRIDDHRLGLLTFDEHAAARLGHGQALDFGRNGRFGHGESKKFIEANELAWHTKIIDLSTDFRDESNGFVYGLAEFQKEKIPSWGQATSGMSLKTLYIIFSPFIKQIILLESSRCFKA